MARKSIIEREKKKIKLVEKFSQKRAALKDEQRKAATFEEKMDIQRKLQKVAKKFKSIKGCKKVCSYRKTERCI